MAAAYASLVSLLNTMDQIQTHPRLSTSFDNYQFESLREKVGFLLDFMEKYSDAGSTEAEYLVRRIAVAARVAEDIIEVEASDRIRAASTHQSPSVLPHLQKIIRCMDSIKEKAIKLKEETKFINHSLPPPSSSPAPPATGKTTTMLGFDGYKEKLLDQLTDQHPARRILPIVGMGGMGKTTLARNVYEYLLSVHHFDVRVWVTVSQVYSARDILSKALSCLGGSSSQTDKTDDDLGQKLYKILYGRRYLIVLDDIWSVKAWEEIHFFLPDNDNGSRIVVTTREYEVVNYFGSTALKVDFLDVRNSWRLFCETTFAEKGCPPELVQVGMMIVRKCKGLPLSISVIGGLLRKSSRNPEYWEEILDKNLFLDSGEGNQPLSTLYTSYKYLPVWLKSCFLYLGLYPEDFEIDVSQLIQLWIEEGFIRSKTQQTLEEVGESYVKELVDRNFLLVSWSTLNKKCGGCKVHALIRDLSIRIGEKEKLFYVQRCIDGSRQYIVDERTARPYLGERVVGLASRLLRVINNIGGLGLGEFNLCFLCHEPRNARYDRTPTDYLPSSVSLLWRLQFLIISQCKIVAPSEVWKMPHLRHIQISPVFILAPPPGDDIIVLKDLQTVKCVQNLILSEEVCERMPNIKEYWALITKTRSRVWQARVTVCRMLGDSINLNPCDTPATCAQPQTAEFPQGVDIRGLQPEPVLETLRLVGLQNLEEIPSGIGEIPTLENMFIKYCSESASISAVKLLKEQESLGNESLRLQLDLSRNNGAETLRAKIEELGFTSQNL